MPTAYKKNNVKFTRLKKANSETEYTKNDCEASDELNNYFKSVFTDDIDAGTISFSYFMKNFVDSNHPDPLDMENVAPEGLTIDQIVVREEDVLELLNKVNPYKSAGDDQIHGNILKECADELCEPLTKLFNLSIQSGIVPASWKSATITALHKGDEKYLTCNYRPISLTSQLCKLLEKIIRKHILAFLTENNLLSEHQHGFCEKKSCMTNLLESLEDITSMIDEGIPVDEIFMDFTKAFDKVSHERLLYKLDKIGVKGSVLRWIESFLCNRQQRTKVGQSYSKWAKVTSGVPQGSVIGPILFLVYINDLPSLIRSYCKVFADDTKFYGQASTSEECQILQDDLDRAMKWADEWKMEFHPQKCHILHFGKKNQHFKYTIGDNVISPVTEEKDLGVTISQDLKWSKHISDVVTKANRMVGLVKHTFSYMDKDMFMTVYKTLIRPLLEYNPQIWNPHYAKDITALEKVQRRATKMVPELSDMSYDERLKVLKLYPLKDRRLRGDMITTYKIINNMINVPKDTICPISMSRTSARRHDLQIRRKLCKTDVRKYFYTQRIAEPWNNLSSNIVYSPTVNSFKANYDKGVLGDYN